MINYYGPPSYSMEDIEYQTFKSYPLSKILDDGSLEYKMNTNKTFHGSPGWIKNHMKGDFDFSSDLNVIDITKLVNFIFLP